MGGLTFRPPSRELVSFRLYGNSLRLTLRPPSRGLVRVHLCRHSGTSPMSPWRNSSERRRALPRQLVGTEEGPTQTTVKLKVKRLDLCENRSPSRPPVQGARQRVATHARISDLLFVIGFFRCFLVWCPTCHFWLSGIQASDNPSCRVIL